MRQFAGRRTASPLTGAAGTRQLSPGGLHGRDTTVVPFRASALRELPSLSRAGSQDDRQEREADAFARASAPSPDFDLSRIRIHADPAADAACRALDARAFTLGRDVFFAAGEYDPVRPAARELLAHEFAHVLQQEAAGEARIQRQPKDPPGSKAAPIRQLTQAEYKAWQRAHPKATSERVGPWLPATMYKQYTKQWFTSRGYFFSGRMVMDTSSGGYDEVWLNNAGDGREYRVYREPERPKAAESKKVEVDDEPADPDVVEAEDLSKDRAAEKKHLILLVEELHRKIGSPEYNGLYNRYRALEDDWLKRLDDDKERVHDLWKASDNNDSRDELSDVEEELGRLKNSWPYGAEWGSRADLPRAPGDNLTIKKPVTLTPTGPITF
jgi:hypothetical protein